MVAGRFGRKALAGHAVFPLNISELPGFSFPGEGLGSTTGSGQPHEIHRVLLVAC